MMQNIEKVLDRGEKLELLVDKTENLRYQADQFQKGGKALRNKMWWQNVKMKLMVFLIVAIVVVIIFWYALQRKQQQPGAVQLLRAVQRRCAAPAPARVLGCG